MITPNYTLTEKIQYLQMHSGNRLITQPDVDFWYMVKLEGYTSNDPNEVVNQMLREYGKEMREVYN